MSTSNLRLVVENLGPIEHADVELKPLTVLIGKNNTGKTYLAQSLYAIHKAVKSFGLSDALGDDEIDLLGRASQTASEDPLKLPTELESKASDWINSALLHSGNNLQHLLRGYFGVPSLEDITRWDQEAEIKVELHQDIIDTERSCLFRDTKTNSLRPLKVPRNFFVLYELDKNHIQTGFKVWQGINEGGADTELRNLELSFLITSAVWSEFLRYIGLSGKAHYLPAGRSGLLNAWVDVVRSRCEIEEDRYGLFSVPDSFLSGIDFDFISSLGDIIGPRRPRSQTKSRKDDTSDTAVPQALLQGLLGGKVRAGWFEKMVPALEYQQDGHRLALHLASSMVTELAPLAMWIEHLVSPNDLLIIDEPESHLHPEAAQLVARVLVGLVNLGIKVVCATQSSILLHELSNCILRGQLKSKHNDHSEKYPGTEQIAIDDIAVYRFQQSQSAGPVRVTQETIEPDWGIPEDEYLEVANELSEDTADLLDLLA